MRNSLWLYILTPSMVRQFISVFCSLAVPTLLVWAYSLWKKGSRRELPHWRNGMGLASVTFTFASWSIQVSGLVVFLSRINWHGFQSIDWYLMYIEFYLPLDLRDFRDCKFSRPEY
jgi:hypothetical protein